MFDRAFFVHILWSRLRATIPQRREISNGWKGRTALFPMIGSVEAGLRRDGGATIFRGMKTSSVGISRRSMISRTAATAGFFAMSQRFAPLFADEKKRRFKIGACEWSLRKSDPTCFDVAKEIGLDGVLVDLGRLGNGMHLLKPEVQQAYLDAAKRTGLEVASLAMGEMNSVPLKNDPRAEEWLEKSVDVMTALKVPLVLVAAFGKGDLCGDKAGIDHTVELLKKHAPKAEKAGVIFGLENYLSAAENLDILDRVGSKAVQVYYDVGNSTDKGYDIYKEIRMLKGRLCEFHAKDGKFMLGQGRVDFKKVREAMDEIDFSGWIHIEAAAPHNLVEDYKADCAFLRSVLS
jgi:sugar phosphate isomerase/epimerase